jgi:hypothetical protein
MCSLEHDFGVLSILEGLTTKPSCSVKTRINTRHSHTLETDYRVLTRFPSSSPSERPNRLCVRSQESRPDIGALRFDNSD